MEPQNYQDQNQLENQQKLFGKPNTNYELASPNIYRKNPLYTIIMEFQVQTLHINLSLN